jgi:hypothetical protein
MERPGLPLTERSGADTAQFLHMCPGAQRLTDMVAERADICTGIAIDPEEHEPVINGKEFDLPDGADPQAALHRAPPGRALVDLAGEFHNDLFDFFPLHVAMQPHEAYVFLVMPEQVWCETDSIPQHHEQDSRDMGVQGSGMPDTAAEKISHPCGHLVA